MGGCSRPSREESDPVLGLEAVVASVPVGAAVEMAVSFRSFVAPLVDKLAPANTVIQHTPTRKSIAPMAFRNAVDLANAPPGGWS